MPARLYFCMRACMRTYMHASEREKIRGKQRITRPMHAGRGVSGEKRSCHFMLPRIESKPRVRELFIAFSSICPRLTTIFSYIFHSASRDGGVLVLCCCACMHPDWAVRSERLVCWSAVHCWSWGRGEDLGVATDSRGEGDKSLICSNSSSSSSSNSSTGPSVLQPVKHAAQGNTQQQQKPQQQLKLQQPQ